MAELLAVSMFRQTCNITAQTVSSLAGQFWWQVSFILDLSTRVASLCHCGDELTFKLFGVFHLHWQELPAVHQRFIGDPYVR